MVFQHIALEQSLPSPVSATMALNRNSKGNALRDCVCSAKHNDQGDQVFWVQCDNCFAWYYASSRCLGFSKQEAKYVGRWTCRECPEPRDMNGSSHSQSQNTKPVLDPQSKERTRETFVRSQNQEGELSIQSQDCETHETGVSVLNDNVNSEAEV